MRCYLKLVFQQILFEEYITKTYFIYFNQVSIGNPRGSAQLLSHLDQIMIAELWWNHISKLCNDMSVMVMTNPRNEISPGQDEIISHNYRLIMAKWVDILHSVDNKKYIEEIRLYFWRHTIIRIYIRPTGQYWIKKLSKFADFIVLKSWGIRRI